VILLLKMLKLILVLRQFGVQFVDPLDVCCLLLAEVVLLVFSLLKNLFKLLDLGLVLLDLLSLLLKTLGRHLSGFRVLVVLRLESFLFGFEGSLLGLQLLDLLDFVFELSLGV
jgi:hypothetical protein